MAVGAESRCKDESGRNPEGFSVFVRARYIREYWVEKVAAFSERLASMRSRWEGRIHVDGSMKGAYMAIRGMTSSRRRAIIKNGMTLFEHEKKGRDEK
jgi:hypothetical protein